MRSLSSALRISVRVLAAAFALVGVATASSAQANRPAAPAKPANTNLMPLVTLKSDATTLGAVVANWSQSSLNSVAGAAGLTFIPVAVGAFGSYTNIPPGAPSGTQVVNLAPVPASGDANSGYFKATFKVPAGVTAISLTGSANVDDTGRVFLNGNPLTQAMPCSGSNCITEHGNTTFSTTNLADFVVGGTNTLLIADANTGGGPSGTAFWAKVSVQAGGNLAVTAVSNPPATVEAASVFSVTDTTRNTGTAAIDPSTTRYYLSPTAAKTGSSVLLTSGRAVPALNAGASSTGTVSVTAPGGLGVGSYYLLACADDDQSVPEASGTVNCKASATTTGVKLSLPAGNSLPTATQAKSYSAGINAAGLGPNYAWTLVNAVGQTPIPTNGTHVGLSDSLYLTNTGGYTLVVGGTPPQSGTVNFAVTVKDTKTGTTAGPVQYTIPVNPLMALGGGPLPSGTVGVTYAQNIVVSGGGPKYTWSLKIGSTTVNVPANGSSVPVGDGVTASNNGNNTLVLGGKPTAATTVSFGAVVKDTATGLTLGPVQYSIQVNSSLSLPNGNPPTLGPATVGQSYTGSIAATGGTSGTYGWWVNGLGISQPGLSVTLSNGLSATTTDNNVLSIYGTPTSAGTVDFTATVTNGGYTVGPNGYSVQVNGAGSQVSGNINLINGCNWSGLMPKITVAISTNPVRTTQSDTNGNFNFQNIPPGSYTVTPSISGPSAWFYPQTMPVTVSNGPVQVGFQVALGYTVSGTANYGGAKTGRVYINLANTQCGGGGSALGTSLAGPGAFTIHGVAPGKYQLQAWMDTPGFGQANATDPQGASGTLTLSGANLNGATVQLSDPGTPSIGSAPQLQTVSPFNKGFFLPFQPVTDSNGIEIPTTYTVQWATTSTGFNTPAGSATFAATGANGSNVWMLDQDNVTGLASGTNYYLRVRGNAGSQTGPWSSPVGPVKVGGPAAGNLVTGSVSFNGTARGPLYVGFYDGNTNKVYATQVGSKGNPPVSPAQYSVHVPSGSSYYFFGIVDQNNDGMPDPGDIQNTDQNQAPVAITKSTTENLTLSGANATARLSTQHQRFMNQNGSSDSYALEFDVRGGIMQPAALEIVSGARTIIPIDVGLCMDCGHPFSYWYSLGPLTPVGAFGLKVTYTDGSSEVLQVPVTTVLNAFTSNMSPQGSVSNPKPNFSWTDPANAGNYTYQFQLWDSNGGEVWAVPGDNSNSKGFVSSVTSLTWGVDPTGGGSTPNVASLANGRYNWQITARDANGNQSSLQVPFNETGGGNPVLSLPTGGNPSSLPGTATVGVAYSGAVNASGGSGGYSFTVNGISVPTQNSQVSIADGIYANSSGGNTLFFTGTPTAAQTVTLNVTVNDGAGDPAASATYQIVVSGGGALGLPGSGSINALVGYPFSQAMNATGGAGPYSFTVNGVKIPTDGASHAIKNGDGLTAMSDGSSTLQFGGTPAITGTVTITVSVTDSKGGSAGPVSYSVVVESGPNGANNGNLKGTYACLTQGFKDPDGSRWASVSSFKADGAGHFTSGVWDENSRYSSSAAYGTVTGTYAIDQHNIGLASTTSVVTQGGSGKMNMKWAIALTDAVSPAQQFRMVEADDVGASASGQHGTANCFLADPTTFTSSTLAGNSFAFGMNGEGSGGDFKVGAGRLTMGPVSAGTGTIGTGYIDLLKGGNTGVQSVAYTGSYTTPDSSTGRFTMTLNVGGGETVTLTGYLVDANRAFILQTTPGTSDGVSAGNVRRQQQTSYSAANLNGRAVVYMQGADYRNGPNSPNEYDAAVIHAVGDGQGNITFDQVYANTGGTYSQGFTNVSPNAVTFDVSHPGRASIAPHNSTVYLYLFNNNTGIWISHKTTDGSTDYGWMEAQTYNNFTNAGVAGTYMLGTMAAVAPDVVGLAGQSQMTAAGVDQGLVVAAGEQSFEWEGSFNWNYIWDTSVSTSGGFFVNPGGNRSMSCMGTNGTKVACVWVEKGSTLPALIMGQK